MHGFIHDRRFKDFRINDLLTFYVKILSNIFKELLLGGLIDVSMCGSRIAILGLVFFCVITITYSITLTFRI